MSHSMLRSLPPFSHNIVLFLLNEYQWQHGSHSVSGFLVWFEEE